MLGMKVDQELVDAAKTLLIARYGETGWGGAAAMYTATGTVLTSVCVEALSESSGLCIETGAIAEAHKLNDPVTASACVIRDDDSPAVRVIASCGACQERLRFWGPDVEVAVPDDQTPAGWRAYRLGQLQPHWWGKAYGAR
jgi:cytidine deaminase